MADSYPRIAQVVLDTRDARRLAEFYRELFGLEYRESDEPPPPDGVQPSTWPDATVPQMFHLDTVVATAADPAGHPFCAFVG